jgi:hypothetical protein
MALLAVTALLLATPVAAQTAKSSAAKSSAPKSAAPPAQRPYMPVAATIRAAPGDSGLAAFRNELTAVAKRRVFADLAKLVVPRGLFWDRDFADGFDAKKSSTENFAAAIKLEQRQGAGWNTLMALAAEAVGGAVPARPGIVCAPAKPDFDEIEFDRLIEATRSEARDWATPRAAGAELRAAPRPNAPVIEKLGMHLLRVAGDEARENDPDAARQALLRQALLRQAWARVIAPSGRVGFVAPSTLLPLQTERLCYAKDVTGRWRIAGYIGAGN